MKIEIEVPDDVLRDLIEHAKVTHWGNVLDWDRDAMTLQIQEDDGTTTILRPVDFDRGLSILTSSTLFSGDALVQHAAFGWMKYGSGDKRRTAYEDIMEILARAAIYDDKPHLLYSFVWQLANKYVEQPDRARIASLMDRRYAQCAIGDAL